MRRRGAFVQECATELARDLRLFSLPRRWGCRSGSTCALDRGVRAFVPSAWRMPIASCFNTGELMAIRRARRPQSNRRARSRASGAPSPEPDPRRPSAQFVGDGDAGRPAGELRRRRQVRQAARPQSQAGRGPPCSGCVPVELRGGRASTARARTSAPAPRPSRLMPFRSTPTLSPAVSEPAWGGARRSCRPGCRCRRRRVGRRGRYLVAQTAPLNRPESTRPGVIRGRLVEGRRCTPAPRGDACARTLATAWMRPGMLSGRGAVRRLDQPATAVADTSRRLPPLRARRDEHAVDEHATVAVLSDGERIAIQAVLLDGLLVGRVDVAVVEPGVIGMLGEDGPRAFVDPDGWVVGRE